MNEPAFRVETAPRLAQWRIESLSSCTYRKSYPFKIGIWNWFLLVERNKQLFVKLYPESASVMKDQPPIASFIVKLVSYSATNRQTVAHPGIYEKELKNSDDFVWATDATFAGKFIVDVEFLDLKMVPQPGAEPSSIWSAYHIKANSHSTALNSLHRMLTDAIYTDVTIDTKNGSISAHRAVLSACSPVFRSMFSHGLAEKELSVVKICDMSTKVCRVFLDYIYGNLAAEEFVAHRLALIRAADKYDMADLKDVCHESLLEDIDAKNVLERLQVAHLYRLQRLKAGCLRYLVNFRKVYEVIDEFNEFLLGADREVISEIFHEILTAWRAF